MMAIIRDRIQDMMKRGMTIEQIKAARPTADYDIRYATRAWTADMFVESVYRTLTPAARQAPGRSPEKNSKAN